MPYMHPGDLYLGFHGKTAFADGTDITTLRGVCPGLGGWAHLVTGALEGREHSPAARREGVREGEVKRLAATAGTQPASSGSKV